MAVKRKPTEMETRCAEALIAKMVEYHGAPPAHVEAYDYVLTVIDELRKPTQGMIEAGHKAPTCELIHTEQARARVAGIIYGAMLNEASPPCFEPAREIVHIDGLGRIDLTPIDQLKPGDWIFGGPVNGIQVSDDGKHLKFRRPVPFRAETVPLHESVPSFIRPPVWLHEEVQATSFNKHLSDCPAELGIGDCTCDEVIGDLIQKAEPR